jgi:predicted permease
MLRLLNDFRRDLRHSGRLLRRQPIFTLTAVLSLTIGIGANVTIFTVANALFLRDPAGVVDPRGLADIGITRLGHGFNPGSYPTYSDVRERVTTLDAVYAIAFFPEAMGMRVAGQEGGAEHVFVSLATSNYFEALGARPSAGRLIASTDREPIVVLSHGYWQRRFNSDPSIVGRVVHLNGHPFTVAGVAQPGFQGTGLRASDMWTAIESSSISDEVRLRLSNRASGWLSIGGRLKSGVTLSQAAAEIDSIGRALQREYPAQNKDRGVRLVSSSRIAGVAGPVTVFLALLIGIVATVLIIMCANLSGVLLARARSRRHETAVRLALGASRFRLIRQLLTESCLLFAIGGAAGLLAAAVVTPLAASLLPALQVPIDLSLALDRRVVLFSLGVSLVAAVFSGLVPSMESSRADVVSALRDSDRSRRQSRLRRVFVVAQVAFSILLVAIAGLFARALQRAGSMDPGFDATGVEVSSIDLSIAGYTGTSGPRAGRALVDRVRALPGVQTATLAAVLPGGFEGVGLGGVSVGGPSSSAQGNVFSPTWNIVDAGYFATLRIPLVSGRDFTAADRAGTEPVAIVGERAARLWWPGQDAVGKYLFQPLSDRAADGSSRTTRLTVVGVARDPRFGSLMDGSTGLFVYVPFEQRYLPHTMIVARAKDGRRLASEIRTVVSSLNSDLPIVASQTGVEYSAVALLPQRIAASIASALGLVGLLLATIGIYGVASGLVASRIREIGIRFALGARPLDIAVLVVREGLWIAAIGAPIGLALAALASTLLAGFLFGLSFIDPPSFLGAAVLSIGSALLACYVPARRATFIDPQAALRRE